MAARSETVVNMVTVIAGLAVVALVGVRLLPTMAVPDAPTSDVLTAIDPELELPVDGASVRGAANAQVVMVEFSDFQCPACGRFARDTLPTIVREFVDTGVVKYVFVNYPNITARPGAVRASEGAECAGLQNAYWPMHDLLFQNQSRADDATLIGHAARLGLDQKEFERCLKSGMRARVDAHRALGERVGVTATPTFLVGRVDAGAVKIFGKIVGAQPYDAFRATLQAQVKRLAQSAF